ncbi:MAG TPA: hypothetical protein VNA15_05655 [Candidatus Angelobacter sp.]|nr:hypothetical protein [Candidatus Angelobacter sp.]
MRINILTAGGLILAVSVLLFNSEIVASVFGFALGSLNLIIAILTARAVGIAFPADQAGPVSLSIDKGVIRANIYAIGFSEKKMVLRKLSSANLTVVAALILAVLGAVVAGYFGVVVGGITAFSLQEFVTQRRKDEVTRGNILDALGSNDLEFPYSEIELVQLLGNRIQIHLKDRVVRIAISRRSARILAPMLEKIIPARILSRPVPSGRDP